jgi:hypothetical protein
MQGLVTKERTAFSFGILSLLYSAKHQGGWNHENH